MQLYNICNSSVIFYIVFMPPGGQISNRFIMGETLVAVTHCLRCKMDVAVVPCKGWLTRTDLYREELASTHSLSKPVARE